MLKRRYKHINSTFPRFRKITVRFKLTFFIFVCICITIAFKLYYNRFSRSYVVDSVVYQCNIV